MTVGAGTTLHRSIVTDHGPGLSDDDKEPRHSTFWKRRHPRPGTGLGLAIADRSPERPAER